MVDLLSNEFDMSWHTPKHSQATNMKDLSAFINPRLDEPDSARGSGKRKRAVAAVRRAMSKVSLNKRHV